MSRRLQYGVAIPTEFNGIVFRSRFEANVAQFLLDLGLRYRYESESFLVDGSHYSPDFYLTECDQYVEVRGYETETSEATLESFVRLHGQLIVFYSDCVQAIFLEDGKIERYKVTVYICSDGHGSAATLTGKLDLDTWRWCWACKSVDDAPSDPGSFLSIEMRSNIPHLVTDVGINIKRLIKGESLCASTPPASS